MIHHSCIQYLHGDRLVPFLVPLIAHIEKGIEGVALVFDDVLIYRIKRIFIPH